MMDAAKDQCERRAGGVRGVRSARAWKRGIREVCWRVEQS